MGLSLIAPSKPQRREAVRYRLRLPVIFHWSDGTQHTEGGFTQDVAMDGAFINSGRCPPIGCDVLVEVLIPSPGDEDSELRIECVCKVVRVELNGGRSGFGVRGHFDDDHLIRYAPQQQE